MFRPIPRKTKNCGRILSISFSAFSQSNRRESAGHAVGETEAIGQGQVFTAG